MAKKKTAKGMRSRSSAGVDPELTALARQYRSLLPEGFTDQTETVRQGLQESRSLTALRATGKRKPASSNERIRSAILDEVSLFLCSEDSRYAELRGKGKQLTKEAALVIAGVVAGALNIAGGVAIACVAYLVQAIATVAVGTFCKLNPPPSGTKAVIPAGEPPKPGAGPAVKRSTKTPRKRSGGKR